MPSSPRPLAALVAASLAMLVHAGSVAAAESAPLQLAADGAGQVLIYPYYTVRDGQASLLTLHNGDIAAKAVRLRLREPLNGRTALSLNLYLRPQELWRAALIDGEDGPLLHVRDDSCVLGAAGVGDRFALTSDDYTGARRDHPQAADPALADIDRVRSGFIEAIEMGTLVAGDAVTEIADEITGLRTPAGIQGRDCDAVVRAWSDTWHAHPEASIGPPRGGLSGSVQIVDVAGAALFAVAATALENFDRNEAAPGRLHAPPAAATPDLAAADHGGFVDVRVGAQGPVVRVDAGGADAVSLALLTAGIESQVDVDATLDGAADVVVTLPTRHHYTDRDEASGHLFTDVFVDDARACVPVARAVADAAGTAPPATPPACIGTPPPFSVLNPPLCASASTVAVTRDGGAGPLRDPSAQRLQHQGDALTLALGFDMTAVPSGGVCPLAPPPAPTWIEVAGVRWVGLPAIGFVAQRFRNNEAQPGRVATYPSSIPHRRLPPRALTP